jgi:hypothetical protein
VVLVIYFLFILAPAQLSAQSLFNGILYRVSDSTALSFAAISLKEINQSTLTDANGVFHFNIPQSLKKITFNISAIGVKAEVEYQRTFDPVEKIYVDITPNSLDEFSIKGLSAMEVVEKAVASIPANYMDSSYFCYSFFRRYEKVNNVFTNLFEAQPVVMFRLKKSGKEIESTEGYAVKNARCSKIWPNITTDHADNASFLMHENPIYHLDHSALNPAKFSEYIFNFDTSAKTEDYVINYECKLFSSDTHGVMSYNTSTFRGESHEKGQLVIERGTFAIKKIHRTSLRYWDYYYPPFENPPNLLSWGYTKYLFYFVDGYLDADYVPYNGKWYLKKLARQYTNEFNLPLFESKEFTITNYYEWYADSVSRFITSDLINQFYPDLIVGLYDYDQNYWDKIDYPYTYNSKEAVMKDLLRSGPLYKQCLKECSSHNERFTEATKKGHYSQ